MSIKPIDKSTIHRITSGQVVIDLQTAVKELVENSLDAGTTILEVRFKQYGLATIEVIDNGGGISEENYEGLALKNHTSKLSSFADLSTVTTFGFRGEALSSLCALCESVVVSTAVQPPMGVTLEMETSGKIRSKGKVARQRGTTITLTNLFTPLPVRRKEFERNAKREFGKALALLNAYALGPCSSNSGVRLTVSNQIEKGQKSVQIRTQGTPSLRASVLALWGPKALDNIIDLDLSFLVERDKIAMKRAPDSDNGDIRVVVRGLISKFAVGCGRTGTDRQFFYVNGRPCNLNKIQKAFNEVYRSFNATQSPFIVADFIIPTGMSEIDCRRNYRYSWLQTRATLMSATLESSFASSRSTYDVDSTQAKPMTQTVLSASRSSSKRPSFEFVVENDDENGKAAAVTKKRETDLRIGSNAPPPKIQLTLKDSGYVEIMPHSKSPEPSEDLMPEVGKDSPVLVSERISDVSTHTVSLLTAKNPVEQIGPSPFLSPDPVPAKNKRDSRAAEIDMPLTSVTAVEIPSSASPPFRTSSSPVGDVVVALDSSRTTWHHKLERKLPDEPVLTPAPSNNDYARKKRRSEPAEISPVEARPKALSRQSSGLLADKKSSRQSLRTLLVGFSRTGSQRPLEVDADVDELESDDEADLIVSSPIGPAATQERKRGEEGRDQSGDSSMEVDSDIPDAAPPMGQAPHSPLPHEEENVGMQFGFDISAASIANDSSLFIDLTDDDMFDSSSLVTFETSILATPSLEAAVLRPEVIRSQENGSSDTSLRFDLSKISGSWERLRQSLTAASYSRSQDSPSKVPLDAGLTKLANDDVATEALARTIDKQDFGSMEIIGQFNLGFIVARRRKAMDGATPDLNIMDDLFIVDQHAADEKYNFETLQQTTHIKSQKLFRPQPLELTAGDELLALENLDVLRQNGFEIDSHSDDDTTVAHGRRLLLTAQPVSKSTVFDTKDLEELIHLMRDRSSGQMVRCSKARAMFAMRACRKSVMVGMPLTKSQMTAVVCHMGTMDQPWNCPHGRPTMRHLSDIVLVGDKGKMGIDWSTF
ncbi:hypothetical protein B0H10DRAFT_1976681 [Mycena sp. CBHHK59/15]|nr:hypothetical protein B0H10DRAFT_1976681 [Mycena sp. CBHHK59/15]